MNTQQSLNEHSSATSAAKCVDCFRYIRSFWQEHIEDPLSATEVALAVYLLDRANHKRWAMPFKCSTAQLCMLLQISRPTFSKARESLSRRGMITYTEGTGTDEQPTYSVVLPDYVMRRPRGAAQVATAEPAPALVQASAPDAAPAPAVTPSPASTTAAAPAAAQISKSTPLQAFASKLSAAYSSTANLSNELVDLNVLNTRLISDQAWMAEIVDMMKPSRTMTAADVKADLVDFFRYLRCQGITAKSEPECRRHFVNWLRKQSGTNSQSTYGAQPSGVDLRRPSPVSATSAADYEGPF